jgi:hypothetical protein
MQSAAARWGILAQCKAQRRVGKYSQWRLVGEIFSPMAMPWENLEKYKKLKK